MSYKKISDLILKLHNNTMESKLQWEPVAQGDIFISSFSNFSVRISQEYNENEGGMDIVLEIINQEGMVIERVSDVDMRGELGRADSFKILNEIYGTARRQALGVETALDEILNELDD